MSPLRKVKVSPSHHAGVGTDHAQGVTRVEPQRTGSAEGGQRHQPRPADTGCSCPAAWPVNATGQAYGQALSGRSRARPGLTSSRAAREQPDSLGSATTLSGTGAKALSGLRSNVCPREAGRATRLPPFGRDPAQVDDWCGTLAGSDKALKAQDRTSVV